MAPIFYVSSWGGSATRWLAAALDLHPAITCHHGSRAAPDNPLADLNKLDHSPGLRQVMAEEYADLLVSQAGDHHFAGAVHGFHGLSCHEAIIRRGGRFGVSVRDPIQRIASLYRHYQNEEEAQAGSQVNFFLNYAHKCHPLVAGLLQAGHIAEPSRDLAGFVQDLRFTWMAHVTFSCDIVLSPLTDAQFFRMEDYTRDRQAFQRAFNYLTRDALPCPEPYLEAVFSQGRINPHRGAGTSPDAMVTFFALPKNHQVIFLTLLSHFRQVLPFYQRMGYTEVAGLLRPGSF